METKEMMDMLYKVNNDLVAEEMTYMLTDTEIKTYDMFEDLVTAYHYGNEDFRKGMDKVLEILLWKNMEQIAKHIKENCMD